MKQKKIKRNKWNPSIKCDDVVLDYYADQYRKRDIKTNLNYPSSFESYLEYFLRYTTILAYYHRREAK